MQEYHVGRQESRGFGLSFAKGEKTEKSPEEVVSPARLENYPVDDRMYSSPQP